MNKQVRCLLAILVAGLALTLALVGFSQPIQAEIPSDSLASAAPMAELHVCPTGCTYNSLQAAINNANPNDIIKMAAGVYTDVHDFHIWSNANYTLTQIACITKSLTIAGGYTGSNWTTPDPIANPTILDADGQGRVVHIYDDTDTWITVTLRGLQISGGDVMAGGAYNTTFGGGIYARKTHLIVEDSQIYDNLALNTGSYGGGIYLQTGSATLSNTLLTHNQVSVNGGAIYLHYSPATLTNNQIISNTAQNQGGGIYVISSGETVIAEGNFIHDNYARFSGGALCLNSTGGVLNDNQFTDNRAYGTVSSHGGAIYSENAELVEINNNTFSGNQSSGRGGALHIGSTTALTMTRTLLQNNSATLEGGAAYLSAVSNAFLENSAMVDNTAGTKGAGLFLLSSDVVMHHLTIARNSGGDGTGVHITHHWENSVFSDVYIVNTIIANHDLGLFLDAGMDQASLNTVLWDGNAVNRSGSIAAIGERFGPVVFDPDGYHIMSGSDAIRRGNPNYTPRATVDIDGDPRPAVNAFDIGADEYPFWVRQFMITPGDLHPGDRAEFVLNITNDSSLTYTASVTDVVPACLVANGPMTWSGTVPPTGTWLAGTAVFTIALNSGDTCTNTMAFTTIEGPQGTSSKSITVLSDIAISGLSAFNDGPTENGNSTTLTATITAGNNVSYTWDFGDGGGGDGATISHNYSTGVYTAIVSASNAISTATATTLVTVYEVMEVAPGGGSITTTNGVLTLEASSMLTYTPTFTYTPAISPAHGSSGNLTLAGLYFDLSAYDAAGDPVHTFSPPLTLTVHYDELLLPLGMNEEDLLLYRWDVGAGEWLSLTVLARDTAADTITVELDHLTAFALLAPAERRIYLPLVLRNFP